jgi:hypothetical protein
LNFVAWNLFIFPSIFGFSSEQEITSCISIATKVNIKRFANLKEDFQKHRIVGASECYVCSNFLNLYLNLIYVYYALHNLRIIYNLHTMPSSRNLFICLNE